MSGQMHVTCVYPEVDRQNKQRRALSPIRDSLLSFQAQRMCLACFAFLFFKFDKRNNLAVAVTNLLTLIPLLIRLWTSFKYLNIKQACLTGLKVFLDLSSCSTGPKKNLDLSSCSNGTPIAHLRAFAYTAQPITLINTTCSFLFLFISRFLCGSLNNPWTSCWRRAWGEKNVPSELFCLRQYAETQPEMFHMFLIWVQLWGSLDRFHYKGVHENIVS